MVRLASGSNSADFTSSLTRPSNAKQCPLAGSAPFPVMVSCFVWPGIDEWVVGSESLPEVKLSWQFPSSFSLN